MKVELSELMTLLSANNRRPERRIKISKKALTEQDIINYVETQKKLKKFFEDEFKPKEEKKDDKKKSQEMTIGQQMILWMFFGMVIASIHFSTVFYLTHR